MAYRRQARRSGYSSSRSRPSRRRTTYKSRTRRSPVRRRRAAAPRTIRIVIEQAGAAPVARAPLGQQLDTSKPKGPRF